MTQFSSTSERAIAAAIKHSQTLRKAEIAQVQTIMRTIQGRQYMWSLLARGQIFIDNQSRDPLEVTYSNGRRSEALYQLDLITRHCPNEYVSMMAENSTNPNLEDPQDATGPDDPDAALN